MAEALLRHRLGPGTAVTVSSAGFLEPGARCPQPVLEVMAEVGLDLSGHRSRRVSPDLVGTAGLVVTMTRQHAVDLAVEYPEDWARFFTLSDLLGRTKASHQRATGEGLESWAADLNAGRARAELLQLPSDGDIPDPIGKPARVYRRVRDQLQELVVDLAEMMAGG